MTENTYQISYDLTPDGENNGQIWARLDVVIDSPTNKIVSHSLCMTFNSMARIQRAIESRSKTTTPSMSDTHDSLPTCSDSVD